MTVSLVYRKRYFNFKQMGKQNQLLSCLYISERLQIQAHLIFWLLLLCEYIACLLRTLFSLESC